MKLNDLAVKSVKISMGLKDCFVPRNDREKKFAMTGENALTNKLAMMVKSRVN
jgi:hypothetical protein